MTRKFAGTELVIATHNKGKLSQIRHMFEGRGIHVTSAADHGLESPAETGTTFLENATLKAVFVARATGRAALADDSGFGVKALGGAPGVYAADWAEEAGGSGGRDYKAAMQKVRDKMGDTKDDGAYYACCLVLAWPDGHTESVEGRVEGRIAWPPRGDLGFGYDPMFQPDGHDKTFAEMTDEEKLPFSHRGRASRLMMKKCF